MKSKDFISQRTRELSQSILAACKNNDQDAIAQAFADFQADVAAQNAEDISLAIQQMDNAVLARRGANQLTSEEKEFFQKLSDASASADPKQAISEITKAMPETVIDTVLEDIKDNHELLDSIDMQNTFGRVKTLINSGDVELATWDVLNTAITTELGGSIDLIDTTFCKLTAFLPVPMDMIELGPNWLLTLTVTILSEAVARGLEKAIICGDGNKQPIGMTRDLAGSVVSGVYPEKTAIPMNEITPATYGGIVAKLAVKPNGGYRTIQQVIMLCNPVDYLTKILPATSVLTVDGTYRNDIFPYPTKVIQSAQLEEGKVVIGIASRYFMGIGSNKQGKIEYDDSTQFLQDNRVYKIKLLGNGRPKDNNAFVVCDISKLAPKNYQVEIVNTAQEPVDTEAIV